MDIVSDLAPTGVLRASINLGNPVLAQGTGVFADQELEVGAGKRWPPPVPAAARRSRS